LFYALSIAIMVVFICLINLHANQLSYYLADAGTLLFVFLASILSFYFPQNLFLPSSPRLARSKTVFDCYIAGSSLLAVLCFLSIINIFNLYALRILIPLYYIIHFFVILF